MKGRCHVRRCCPAPHLFCQRRVSIGRAGEIGGGSRLVGGGPRRVPVLSAGSCGLWCRTRRLRPGDELDGILDAVLAAALLGRRGSGPGI
jgi:hypothetical protein